MNIRKIFFHLLCITLCLALLSSCTAFPSLNKNEEIKTKANSYYEFFDTVSVILSYRGEAEAENEFSANCEAVYGLLEKYHQLFDIYYEYSDINNLKTINKNAGVAPVKVDRELIDLLLYSKEIYALTNGTTNIAMGSVLKLWHDAREDGEDDPEGAYLPSENELSEAAKHTDINSIVIDEEAMTVFISDEKTSIDVGAIAKGYATEKAAELLLSRGVTSYVLNIGGNIRALGEKSEGEGWITGITNPDKTSEESFACKISIKNTSLVTSGDYERYYTVNGVRYHHIIDPKTNMPAKYFSSISVLTENSGLADALSTALFCMSYEDGLELVNSVGGVDVIWILPDGTLKTTENIELIND